MGAGMIDLQDIHSLTDFARHTREFVRRLKKTGRPTVLTVNGRAEFVVQEAASYQRLLDIAARAGDQAKLDRSLDDLESGRATPFEAVAAKMKAKFVGKNGKQT
jgi:PHD/YefM family antitoxin component YafN of YafNO toxin-antitoxin module